jgi:myosin-5
LRKYKLQSVQKYHYVNQSECYEVPDIDDAEEFQTMIQCMRNVQFTEAEVGEVLDCVVAVLNLGNVGFAERENDVGPTFESK